MCLQALGMYSGKHSKDAMLLVAGKNAHVVKDSRKENYTSGASGSAKLPLCMALCN